MGGGDLRTLPVDRAAIIAGKSSSVACGVKGLAVPSLIALTDGVRRCFVRYEAERGSDGREPVWRDGRRLASGDVTTEEAGDRWDGGV